MAKRMLIDAAHPEEIRIAILYGSRLEDYDFEAATKRQIKGNIYLAKVTRVEPSLQAAFVEYGGNRHGFLAFNEIHPDYYRIPVSDRAAFQSVFEPRRPGESAESDAGDGHDDPRDDSAGGDFTAHDEGADAHDHEPGGSDADRHAGDEVETDAEPGSESSGLDEFVAASERSISQAAQAGDQIIYDTLSPDTAERDGAIVATTETFVEPPASSAERSAEMPEEHEDGAPLEHQSAPSPTEGGDDPAPPRPETVGGDELEEAEAPRPRFRSHRHYKIQEVIKRRQIMLVQVTKEERGNKGAALTTYLSLAGRYCVLMPNTPRGGGVSRKITSMQDRRRLKDLMSDLRVPDGMGVIVRTAGSERSKPEIKRDFEYLMRLWEEIRDLTLKSTAPSLVYEEGNLIKRSIRDLYSRDIDEVVVDGDDGYRSAKAFMKMLMPSHAKRVKPYRDPTMPLFHRHQVEGQIDAIHSPTVQLRSGGYIVINPTEALVAIDVNSGRATRERNIEETALRTNLEAADEVARQLRLRDLAGLIVVDFIDMEESRNNIQVERRIKDAMHNDRARIQIGRISAFGLLELSRQRLRPSLLEASTEPCPHCGGTGHIRSTESTALHILRAIEEEGMRRRSAEISVAVPGVVALYLLNHKREALSFTERRYGFTVTIGRDDTLVPPAFRLDRLRALTPEEIAALPTPTVAPLPIEEDDDDSGIDDEMETEEAESDVPPPAARPPILDRDDDIETETETETTASQPREDSRGGARGRGRRHRRRGEGRDRPPQGDHHHGDKEFTPRPPRAEATDIPHEGASDSPSLSTAEPAANDPGGTAAVATAEAEREAQIRGTVADSDDASGALGEHKRRRRGRRGGRRRRREHEGDAPEQAGELDPAENGDEAHGEPIAVALAPVVEATDGEASESFVNDRDTEDGADIPASEAPPEPAEAYRPPPAPEPARAHEVPEPEAPSEPEAATTAEPAAEAEPETITGLARRGWWRRR